MVSVDRNTLISQIVSLNPQLKPDELRKLSDAQLQAKLSQCIAGNKQDKNVDSIKINNNNTSETPKMTTEEAQDNAIENIESNAEQAQKLLDAQDDGDISKAYNFVKEKLNSELAKSNVAKVVHKQFETAEFLREAKQGTLTYKEYLRRKREDIFKTFPEIDNYNDKQKQMIKKGLDSLTEGQLNRLQNQLLALPKKDDKNYQNSVNSFKQNFFEESTVEKTTTARIGEVSKTSKSREIKKAYNPSDGDRLMTFEETYLLEQGVEFNKENIQKFNDSTAQYTFANSLTNKRNEIHSLLTSALEKAKVQGSTGLSSVDLINAELIPSIGASITKLYGKDNLAKGLKDLTNGQYSLNDEIKSLEDLSRKDLSAMNNIAKLILTKIDENYSKALNGKRLEDYAKTMANDYKNAYGTKDASALASSFAQDQEGIVQTARNTVQIAGMVVMVGGMAFCPPAALGGGLISSFGGIGVEAYNENTKENPDEEKNKELGQEALVNAALFAIGAGSGKVGSMAKTALTAKNAPKLVAAMADIGVDSSLSLLGDLTLTGQIDLSGEGFSQLMSLVAGHKGKIIKGVQKGKQFLKEKLNAQANSNNKILQMPDGTLVEVKPDGSTVEVKNDGKGTKAVKPEAKTENIKTETTDKTDTSNIADVNVKSEAFKSEKELKNYLDNRKDLKAYEKSQLMELYKQDAEIVSISLKETKKNYLGQDIPTFSFKDIDSLVKVAKINHNLVKDLINEKVIIYGEETPRFSRHDIVKLVEISKENPQLVSNLVYEKVKDSTGNEIPKFNAFEISNILDMYKQNPNIPDKLLATDKDGNYKLTKEQRDNIIRSSSQPFIQSEDFIDSITILNSKGIEIKDFTEISTKDKADAFNIIAKTLEKIDINMLKNRIDENALKDMVNSIKSSEDVQLIDKYLNKYKNCEDYDVAQVGSLIAFHNAVAKASPDKQATLKNILTNLLDKNIEAFGIFTIMKTLSNTDFNKFNVNNYISQIKNTDDVDTIILLTATNDMSLINSLKQEKYNNFSIANKLLIAETVSEYNIPLYQVVNRFEYYNNLKTQDEQNVIKDGGLSRKDNLKYMLGLPDASRLDIGGHRVSQATHIVSEKSAKSSTAVQELTDLVKDGVVGNHVLAYLPKEGELPPVIAKEIHRFYEAYLNHENFDDVLVPRVKSLNESLEYKSGDVFEVEGDPKIYIKGANNENIQLDIDKATYCKLFPPIERFSSTQNAIGNCGEVTGFNTIFRDPKERSRVLQCFHQKGDDVVVEFPNSNRQYSLTGMKNQANMDYLSEGSLGFKLLEYADGKEFFRERMNKYLYNMSQKINDPSIDVAKRNELKKELYDFLNLSADDKNRIYLDRKGYIIDKPEKMYDGGSTYARDGVCSSEVFQRLGYKYAGVEYFAGDNLDNLLTNPDNFKRYIMSIDIGGEGMESEIDIAKGLYSNHAYMLTPNIDPNGKITDYNLLNPWGIVETKLTLEEIKKYAYMLESAER